MTVTDGTRHADHVVSALEVMATSARLNALFSEVLLNGWHRWGMPASDLPEILVAAQADPAAAANAAHRVAPYLAGGDSSFAAAYAGARAAKFDAFAELIGPYVRHGLVCDVGAGDTQLISRLETAAGERYLATDVVGVPDVSADRRLSFVLQPAADRLPVPDATATTVLATGMLHHMDAPTRSRLLTDIRRCLRPDGVLVLLEETFPAEPWESRSPVDERFQALPDAERRAFLALTDWWGNRVMKNLPAVPLPCTFLDLAGWEVLLPKAGLAVRTVDYLGVVDCHGHMATPRALIVAEPV